MNKTVNNFIKNTAIFLLGSFGSKFLTFLLIPLYTSILTTSQYGKIDLVTTTQGLLLPIATLGLSEAIFRFVMNGKIKNENVLSNGIIIELISYCIVLGVASIVNTFLKWEYMSWMLILLFGSMVYDVFTNYLKAIQKSHKYVLVGILYTTVNLACNIVFLIYFKWGIEGYLLATAVAYFVPSIFVFFNEKLYKQISIYSVDAELGRRMLKYSIPLIFTSLSWWIVTSSDRYMIRYFMTASDVGIYSIASKIPLILQTLISILQTVWQISTNQIHDEEPQQLKANFILFTRAFRQVGFISGSVLMILTQPIMMILARNEFYNGWIYAPFLILSIVFSFSTGMVATLYGAYEKNTGILYSVLIGGGINIILNAILIPSIGVMGATISTAISRLFIAIYRLKDTEKFLKFDRGYRDITINCILAISQCCSLIFLKKFTYPIQCIFLVVIIIYNREVLFKAKQYVGNFLRRK